MNRTRRTLSLFLIKTLLMGSGLAHAQSQQNASTTRRRETNIAAQTGGTPGRIAKFTDSRSVGDSNITEDSSGNIGIGTTLPTSR